MMPQQIDQNILLEPQIPNGIIDENIVYENLIDDQFKGRQRPSSMIVFKTNNPPAPFQV